jgi:hypothetical protein
MRTTLILMAGLLLAGLAAFCPAGEEKKETPPPAVPAAAPATPAAPAAAEGAYELVDTATLQFRIRGQSYDGSTRDDDGVKPSGGKVGDLSCEGQKIELTSDKFEDGFIATKQYGKIKVRFTPTMLGEVLNVFVTPAQKQMLLRLKGK